MITEQQARERIERKGKRIGRRIWFRLDTFEMYGDAEYQFLFVNVDPHVADLDQAIHDGWLAACEENGIAVETHGYNIVQYL